VGEARVAIDRCLEEVARVRRLCADVAPRIVGSEAWSAALDRIGEQAVALAGTVVTTGPEVQTAPMALRHRVAAVRTQADGLREEAGTVAGEATGQLAARDELRGRLDAYRAKASAEGRAEDLVLDELYQRVRAALYEAPCDLGRARALAEDYQRAVRAGAAREA